MSEFPTFGRDRNELMARDAAKIGGYLECQVKKGVKEGNICGKRIHIPEDEAAATRLIQGYLRNGWPAHCGVTMVWVTLFEAKHGPKAMREQLFDPDAPPEAQRR